MSDFNHLMNLLNPYNYEPLVLFDPNRLADIIVREPLGVLAVCVALSNLCLMVGLKLLDLWWDARKQKRSKARLQIELFEETPQPQLVDEQGSLLNATSTLTAVLTNRGNEPLIIREVGIKKASRFQSILSPFSTHDSPLPLLIPPKEIKSLALNSQQTDQLQGKRLIVKDSLGHYWS